MSAHGGIADAMCSAKPSSGISAPSTCRLAHGAPQNHFTKALRIALSGASASNYLGSESLGEIIVPLGHFNRGANLFEGLGHRLDVFALK
jgi:hypothetical protein